MHQNSQTSIRKLAFRRACSRVFRSQTSQQYRHGTLTPDYVRQSGLEPPPLPAHSTGNSQSPSPPTPLPERRPRGGTRSRPLRMLSWNAGHLGVQQWAEVTAWLHTGASDSCDVMALQETHWNETAEFTVEGWQCISSAKKGAPRAPKGKAKPRQRRRPQQPAPQEDSAMTAEAQVDTSRADGVMLLLSPAIDKKTIRWKEHLKGRLIQASFSRMVLTEKCTPKQGRQVQISGLTGLGATCHPCQGHAAAGGRLQRAATCQPEPGRSFQHS